MAERVDLCFGVDDEVVALEKEMIFIQAPTKILLITLIICKHSGNTFKILITCSERY